MNARFLRGCVPVVTATSLLLVTAFAACGGGDGQTIDIRDFDTARMTTTQTSTVNENVSQLTGEGVIDNRKQALSVTYQGESGGQIIAIGRTIYTYNKNEQRWTSVIEPTDGQVGFGRPYWPKFWLDAVQTEDLGHQILLGTETTGYRLLFDLQEVGRRLSSGGTNPVDVSQAEVEVWVDNNSRYAVQLTFRMELTSGSQSTKLEITSAFSDFGAAVDIEVPVASPTP